VIDLTVLPVSSPLISISTDVNTNTGNFLTQNSLLLVGLVITEDWLSCTWTCSDSTLNLTFVSLLPTYVTSLTGLPFMSRLLLPSQSLRAGVTLTFSLMCVSRSTANSSPSSSSYTITTNRASLPGMFSINPRSGVEFNTTFSWSASLWIDNDLPLTYQFQFQDPTTSQLLTIQSASVITHTASSLPGGLVQWNHTLRCMLLVFDSFSVNSSVSEYVRVKPVVWSIAVLLNAVSNQLLEAEGDSDSMTRVISTLTSTVNRVNCSAAPNCTTLHRSDCSSTANTCGPCLSARGYVGIAGHSNEACISIDTLKTVSQTDNQTMGCNH
jgi:hypothetical protein